MSDFDLLVRSEQDIGIAEGRFVAIGRNLSGSATEEIDATRLLIFPGVIDAHVHFNEPGRTDWEGFVTGSGAAAAGGTTTVFEMPLNAQPPTIDGASFDRKRAVADAGSMIDYGLWGGLIPGNLNQLETLRDRGVVGLKAFMCYSGIDDFPQADPVTLREGMRIAADLGLLVAVHAESETMTRKLTGEKMAAAKTSIADYLESRPVAAELEAIEQAIALSRETGCQLHIVHVSCGSGVELVKEARRSGANVTCETCPHYLLLNEEDLGQIGAMAKCAPPLRSVSEQERLWNQLRHVDTIGSDHSPCPPEMKAAPDFFKVWGGISGCQHLLSLLVDATRNHRSLSHEQIVSLTSGNPADRFGIPGKGRIEIGYDADLALIDPTREELVTEDRLRYRHRQSVYVGRRLNNRVVRTILRGQTIYQDGKLPARPMGKLVQPRRQ